MGGPKKKERLKICYENYKFKLIEYTGIEIADEDSFEAYVVTKTRYVCNIEPEYTDDSEILKALQMVGFGGKHLTLDDLWIESDDIYRIELVCKQTLAPLGRLELLA